MRLPFKIMYLLNTKEFCFAIILTGTTTYILDAIYFFFKGYIPFIVIKYWLKLPRLKLVSSLGLSFHPKTSSWLHVPWWDQPHCCRVSEGEGLCQPVLFRCC